MASPLTDYVDRAVAELDKPESAGDRHMILRSFLADGALLSLKTEWETDDNFTTTEDVAEAFKRYAPPFTLAEARGMAQDWDIEEFHDAEGVIHELDDEDEEA